jgi:CheY-like chemotaxis protein
MMKSGCARWSTWPSRQRGYEVIEAQRRRRGGSRPQTLPDLVLCDVNMDKMDGYATLSALRNESATATIPFILMTGLADNARDAARHGTRARTIIFPNLSRWTDFTRRWKRA